MRAETLLKLNPICPSAMKQICSTLLAIILIAAFSASAQGEKAPLSKRLARLFYASDLAFSKRISPEEAKVFRKPSEVLHWLRKKFVSLFEEYF